MHQQTLQQNPLITAFQTQIEERQLDDHLLTAIELEKKFFSVSFSIDSVDVLAALEQVKNDNDFQYYWEKPSSEFSISAAGSLARITNSGENRFRESSKQGKKLLNTVYHVKGLNHTNAEVHLFGGFSFFDESTSKIWQDFNASSFTLPTWMIIREGKCTILTVTFAITDNDQPTNLKSKLFQLFEDLAPICNVDEYVILEQPTTTSSITVKQQSDFDLIHWIETVKRAKKCIKENTFEKVVLARELVIQLPESISETQVLHILRKQYPDCYSFLIRHSDRSCFVGSTPERLASFQGDFILTEGLAGSASRGSSASEDVVFENNLMNSAKDRHEHEIVLDAIEERLTPFSKKINQPKQPSVKKLSNVQHLFTPITATIKEGVSRTEVLKNLHPTPAVGGFPREQAVKFIKQHEDFDRGWYAGPIGWINTSGNGEFAVAIRSGLFLQNEVRFFAGCGIVQDSDPKKEWDETNMKFIPMLTALEHAGS